MYCVEGFLVPEPWTTKLYVEGMIIITAEDGINLNTRPAPPTAAQKRILKLTLNVVVILASDWRDLFANHHPSGFGHFGGWRNLPIPTASETARLVTDRRTESEYSMACKSAALRRKTHITKRRRLWFIPFVVEPYTLPLG